MMMFQSPDNKLSQELQASTQHLLPESTQSIGDNHQTQIEPTNEPSDKKHPTEDDVAKEIFQETQRSPNAKKDALDPS